MFARSHLIFASLVFLSLPLAAEEPKPTVSGPFVHSNLTVFLLHGKDQLPGNNKLLTLGEALEQKKLIVHETANVNQLAIENVSDDVEVFVQSGDIVKGGQQDRLIASDMILPPKSGKVAISSFCCESGRWTKRGSESSTVFGESTRQASNKDVKLALNCSRDQQEVWNKVQEAQKKLTDQVGKPVASPLSPSSYQLTLEDKDVLAKVDAYSKTLTKLAADHADAIGFVIVINGKIEGAELYGSHGLFAMLWPKLLNAAAIDALSERDAKKPYALPSEKDVEMFLAKAMTGKVKEAVPSSGKRNEASHVGGLNPAPSKDARIRVVATETDKTFLLEAKDVKNDCIVHRCYIAK